MILFSLVLLYDQWLLPKIVINHHRRRTELDTVDHTLLWIIKIGMILFFITSPDLFEYTTTIATSDEASSTQRPPQEFFFACSGGDIDHVKESLQKSPQWANSRTENGETPLHLTGIYGHSEITKLLLEHDADPNARSTYTGGLRMHPLSWNVYGGHIDNIRLLLEYGANVNLDFDSMKPTDYTPTTVLDVVIELTKNEQGDERFVIIEKLLRAHGAKTITELQNNEIDDTTAKEKKIDEL